MKKSMWGQFWSAHQRFFKYLCIASKVRRVVQLAREEVQNGKVGLHFQCAPVVFCELAGSSNSMSLLTGWGVAGLIFNSKTVYMIKK